MEIIYSSLTYRRFLTVLLVCDGNNILKWLGQKQPPELFCKKGVLKNFIKFTEKHLCQRCILHLEKNTLHLH